MTLLELANQMNKLDTRIRSTYGWSKRCARQGDFKGAAKFKAKAQALQSELNELRHA